MELCIVAAPMHISLFLSYRFSAATDKHGGALHWYLQTGVERDAHPLMRAVFCSMYQANFHKYRVIWVLRSA